MYPNIKAEMARRNITMKKLAEDLGMRLATLSDKMNGKYEFNLDEINRIKTAIGVDMSIDELFERRESA